MSFFPLPHIMADTILDIEPEMLADMGIKLMLLDVDNTISPYRVDGPTMEVVKWIKDIKAAGIEPFILSNNKGDRPSIFARALDVDYIGRAGKPKSAGALKVMRAKGISPAQTAVIGDQIYTDALCARLSGAVAITVKPIKFTNPLLALRYGLEAPFRGLYRLIDLIKSK